MIKYISPQGLEKLKKELQERKTAQRQEIALRLEEAKSLGDLSENAEYQSAKEAQAFNEGRVYELENILKGAEVIKSSKREPKEVGIGATVEIKSVSIKTAQNQTFMIVGSHEADPIEGRISNESPLGKAFLGRQKGDITEVETPKGKMKYKIVGIK